MSGHLICFYLEPQHVHYLGFYLHFPLFAGLIADNLNRFGVFRIKEILG